MILTIQPITLQLTSDRFVFYGQHHGPEQPFNLFSITEYTSAVKVSASVLSILDLQIALKLTSCSSKECIFGLQDR